MVGAEERTALGPKDLRLVRITRKKKTPSKRYNEHEDVRICFHWVRNHE